MYMDNLKESGWSRHVWGWSGKFPDDPKGVRIIEKCVQIILRESGWFRNVSVCSGKFPNIFGTCLCRKHCKPTFYVHLLQIWKLTWFTPLFLESFCDKNLAIRKVFAFSDSALDWWDSGMQKCQLKSCWCCCSCQCYWQIGREAEVWSKYQRWIFCHFFLSWTLVQIWSTGFGQDF